MALVLSGGGGEQLSVLTAERAVSAVPFGGKYRIIDFVLSNCCHSGILDVGVITQHAPTSLHDHIGAGRPWDLDNRAGGVIVLQPYLTRSQMGWYRGTADALAHNQDVLEERNPEHVLVLSGDHVYRMDYRQLLHTHHERRAGLTLAVARVAMEQSRRFGMVRLDRDGRVLSLIEKPEHSTTPFASMGIYLFDYSVLAARLRDRPIDLVLDVVRPMLEAGERVYAHEFPGYWEDVGTVTSFFGANLELVSPESRFRLYEPRWPILTRDEERPPVRIEGSAHVEDSLIANGCRVAGTVHRSVLSPGVRVEPGAVVIDSVIMSDVVIESGARVDHAILDKYARVGRNARVGGGDTPEDARSAWLGGITLVGKSAEIPPNEVVGRASVIGVGARAQDFHGPALPAGSVIPSRGWMEDYR